MDLASLTGPLIGAVIGYGTNWVAIKMLFRPLKPVKIGEFTLPFTPGIIPKRKDKLAKAIGESVGNQLFTKHDMEEMLLSEDMENAVVEGIFTFLKREESIQDFCKEMMTEAEYFAIREKLTHKVTEKIKQGLLQVEIGQIIAQEGGQVIRNKVKGSMLRMLVTDGLIDSIVGPMGTEIEKYIEEHGKEHIFPVVEGEITSLENSSIQDLGEQLEFDREKMENIIKSMYQNLILKYVKNLLEKLDISKVVEEKVNKMEVLELERLLMSIMKKELSAIVNLGALIGLILGSLNLVI